MPFPVPANEADRLRALRELEILDTDTEQLYDDVVQLASAICRTPMAVMNFVDADRQWGKALVGLDSSEVPRDVSFCARTICTDEGLLVVSDTLDDEHFATNPFVLGDPGLRFYAGASIVTAEGHALGSVCVCDTAPRTIDGRALDALRALARQTAAHLELRRRTSRLHAANAELQRLAVEDQLTGLPNRTLLHDRLGHALGLRRRTGRPVGVLFGDLDGFKWINDRLGHEAGDQVLRAVAARLRDTARETDTVARLAGDEFVVVCPELAAGEDLALVARRLQAAVARPLPLAATTVVPQLSLGWALAEDGDEPADVLRRADAAMYVAKGAGRSAALPSA